MNSEKIGRFIAERRKSLGYTQEQLGMRLQVSDKAVSKWERGQSVPDIFLMAQLAVELKTSVASLLDGEERDVESSYHAMNKDKKAEENSDLWAEEVEADCSFTRGNVVSPYLFGCNLEHTRADIYGGLSAQMLKNRKFAGKPSAVSGHATGWYPIGKPAYTLAATSGWHPKPMGEQPPTVLFEPYTRHYESHYHMQRKLECNAQRIVNFREGEVVGFGQHEVFVQKEKFYDFSIVAKALEPIRIKIALTSRFGKKAYAEETIEVESAEWIRYPVQLVSLEGDTDADLQITFSQEGCLDIGAVSLMPSDHYRGMRREVIERMKEMGIKVLRWPGGNFAGEYNWFDGLLPVDMRAPIESALGLVTQPHSLGFDNHEINTDDFIALCRAIGAQPIITLNLTWNTPEENAMWVEYCNGGPDTEFGRMRIERGFTEPYNVMLWALGNEFGCGHMEGDNTPHGYYRLAKTHLTAMRKVCKDLNFFACGPHPHKEWADCVTEALYPDVSFSSLHYYAPERVYGDRSYVREDYLAGMGSVKLAQETIRTMRSYLKSDIKLSFDEWNVWYAWYRPSSVTDGIFTALMFHMLIGEAEKSGIAIACHFEAVNEGSIIVTPDQAKLTATGQAFSVMKNHINGRVCYLSDSVLATTADHVLTVTAINASYDKTKKVTIKESGEMLSGKLYYGEEVLPYSVFETREADVIKEEAGYSVTIPTHSLVLLKIRQ